MLFDYLLRGMGKQTAKTCLTAKVRRKTLHGAWLKRKPPLDIRRGGESRSDEKPRRSLSSNFHCELATLLTRVGQPEAWSNERANFVLRSYVEE